MGADGRADRAHPWRPGAGPLRCSFRSRFVHDGLLDEDGEIWDSTGVLVAQSRQLALVPRPARDRSLGRPPRALVTDGGTNRNASR